MKKVLAVLLVVGLSGCMTEPDIGNLVKHMVVQTSYDATRISENQNVFNDYATFVLRADTVGFVSTYSRDTILLDNSTQTPFVKAVINEAALNATSRGFTRVDADENPDFALKIVVLENFNFYQTVSYPGYYSGYYGYYGGYYGPIVSTYSSNFVTMVIEAVDIKHYAANNNKYVVIWSAYIGDLYTTDDVRGKLLEAVDRAFEQSPYFSKD
jgi:hypothetical protein